MSSVEQAKSGSETPVATHLKWETFISPGLPFVSDDIPPGESVRMFSPITSTLIYGERDAVLIDTPTTNEQAAPLVEWLASRGKNLVAIYITHGHGDHFFGTGAVQERFPDARCIATPDVIDRMQDQLSPAIMSGLWQARFPGQIPDNIVIADPIHSDTFLLEGQELRIVSVGHSDTEDTTCLYVPSLDLVVAGDVAYNDVHQYMGESVPHEKRMEWVAALDMIDALNPKIVIAGHKKPGNDDDAACVETTRQYILNFDRLAEETGSVLELYEAMLKLYPDHHNVGALWGSCRSVKIT